MPYDDGSLVDAGGRNECFSGCVDAAVLGLLARECSKYCTVHMHGAAPDPSIARAQDCIILAEDGFQPRQPVGRVRFFGCKYL